jgi:MATE family, multidrug efflux pump
MTEAASRSSRLEGFLENPRRALWRLAVPMMIGMSLQTAYMLADLFFVGRLSPDALAAVAFNMPLVFLGLGLVFGLGSGVTAVIARAIGSGDKRLADASAEHALALGLVVSALLTLVAFVWGKELLATLGVSTELMPLAWDYFSVIAAGYVFVVMSTIFRSILAGEGDMRTPMMIQGAGTLLNIGLDPIFIFTLGLGVKGAALATVISQAVPAAVFVYFLFFRDHAYVTFDLASFRFSPAILRDTVRIGAPASFSFLVMAIGGAVFNRILVEFSESAVAAYQVGTRIDYVYMLPVISISASLVTLVGMFHGAKRGDLVRATVTYALTRSIAISVLVGVLFFLLAPDLFAGFSDSSDIVGYGVSYLRFGVFSYPFIALVMLTGRVLQGLGRGVPMLVLSLLRVVLFSAPAAFVFVFWMNEPVTWVWSAIVGGAIVTALVAGFWLKGALSLGAVSVESSAVAPASGLISG